MKYNIVQSLPVHQQDRVVMVEQANVSMYSKKIKPDESSTVYFSHWRTAPTCEVTKIRKDVYSQKSLKRREISKIGSVKFYTYQPTRKDSNRKSKSASKHRKNESIPSTYPSPPLSCTLSPPTCCISTTTISDSLNEKSSFILDTLNLSNRIIPSSNNQFRVPRTSILSIKELLN